MTTKNTIEIAGHDALGLPYAWNSMGNAFYPTPCCGATGKGSNSPTGVVCRACYRTVGEEFGDTPIIPSTEGDIAFWKSNPTDWIGQVGTVTRCLPDGTIDFQVRADQRHEQAGQVVNVPARSVRFYERPSMNKEA